MRQLDLFFFLLFIFAASNKFVESIESDPKTWTILKNGKTYVALHILPERINIAFPKQITFDRLASDLTIYSPVQECENTETLKFKLLFSKELYVRGIILSDISVLLYEKCDDEENPYNIVSVKDDGLKGLKCFKNGNPFILNDKNNYVMEMQVSGSFACDVFMAMPSYMKIENLELNSAKKFFLLSDTSSDFGGDDENWKSDNDQMLPSGLSFDENKNVQIDILNSVKEIPYFFRIGLNRKYPRLNFTFDSQCIKTKFEFELYINGLDSEECKIDIRIIENGFNVSTNNANWTKIFDPDFSPTLAFDANQVFFKLETISIRPFDTCEFNNTLEIPKDQFVLQFNPKKVSEDCVKAVVIIPKIDVPNGIKVLIDPLKVNQNSLPPPDIYSTSTMLMPTDNSTVLLPKDNSDELISIPSNNSTATSLIPWWWFLIAVILLIIAIIAILISYCIYRRRRKNEMLKKSVPPKKVEEVQKLSSTKTAILKESPPKRKSKEKKKNRKRKTQKKEEINESSNKSEKPKSKPPSIIELGKEQQQQPKPDESPKKGHERMAPSQGTDDSKNDKSSTVLSTTIMINVEDGSSKVNQSESQKRNGSEIKSIKSLTNFPEI